MAKVKTAEQYRALRKRETAKRHKRNRTGKSRESDIHGWTMGAVMNDFGPEGIGKYIGHYVKPNHASRAVNIAGCFEKALDSPCELVRNLQTHHTHGRCPGYLRTREDRDV